MNKYRARELESKWQKVWEEYKLYKTNDEPKGFSCYILDMFPYPSGDGLHVGHFKGYTATDVIARFLRSKGNKVLHPMGWDAFGLPAENYAIKTGIHPKVTTAKNIERIRAQMKMVGLSYDWDREINTTDPDYYKWTQWIFLKLFEKGLAYEAEAPINWCPKDKTGLANEEVVNGVCDRCGTPVVRKKIRQWVLAITKYADRLLAGLEGLDWPKPIVDMQRNWIGRSEGAEIRFKVDGYTSIYIDVFTTRIDTLFGATYLVFSPEHELVEKITSPENRGEVRKYIDKTNKKTDLARTDLAKVKTGVFTGSFAINPVDGQKIPIWIADYVLTSYGTGAIMAVPAHDERDWQFAREYKLPIKYVIEPSGGTVGNNVQNPASRSDSNRRNKAFVGYGVLINSGKYSGLSSKEAKDKMIVDLESQGMAKSAVSFKLRDWIFSRQRYWGEPIPIVHCAKCGTVPIQESDLPLLLPEIEKYQPTGTGESPLAAIDEWVNVKCPNCDGDAKRETNTMPQWAGSCWYYLRFIDPHNRGEFVDKKLEKYWLGSKKDKPSGGVDWYVGGAEHAVLHLLYARFWHKFLFDIGAVSTEEPFYKLRNVGLIMGPDGQKMSKSRGNVISPEEMVNSYGADALRLFEMFIGPFSEVADWNPRAVEGVNRFIRRVWQLCGEVIESGKQDSSEELSVAVNELVGKLEADIMAMKFNTAVAAMMSFVNLLSAKKNEAGRDVIVKFIVVMAPFVPHIAEELWQLVGNSKLPFDFSQGSPKRLSQKGKQIPNYKFKPEDSIHSQPWPEFDTKIFTKNQITIVVQINGKLRDSLLVEAGTSQQEAEKLAIVREKVQKYLSGKSPRKVIFVSDRLINFVIK